MTPSAKGPSVPVDGSAWDDQTVTDGDTRASAYQPPPEGWVDFGTHAPLSPVPSLEFSTETAEDGLPRWERLLGSGTAT